MEKEAFFGVGVGGAGAGDHQLPGCFLNLSWDQSADDQAAAAAQFEPALSSMVSSPGTDPAPPAAGGGAVIRELFGRLGSICSSGEVSPTDPGFAERAARLSCFGGGGTRSYGQLGGLSSASSSQSLKSALPAATDGPQLDQNEQEEPSVASDRGKASGGTGGTRGGKKRKASAAAAPRGRGREAPPPPAEEEEDDDGKPFEPPKQDYIHVRARRGQATDSHSLAERVRREKISERMKFLQDLVPGCNKVTGKAVMLDEIINYVQSLQRQVEFLSMKLSTVNPRLEFDVDSLVTKDQIHQPRRVPAAPHLVFPTEATSAAGFPYGNQSLMEAQSSAALRQPLGVQLPNVDSLVGCYPQLGAFWEDDLQSVVQMGFGQNQEYVFSSSQASQGSLPTNHMKIEL